MPVLVDGNNLMYLLAAGDRSRTGVRRLVLDLARRERITVTIVFDGPPPAGTPEIERLGRVTVRYSGTASADEVILRLLPAGNAARSWTVVSGDRELVDRARNRGARTRPAREWAAKLPPSGAKTAARDRALSVDEVAEWERYFGLEE